MLVASSDVLLQAGGHPVAVAAGGPPVAVVRPRVRALASVWQALELRRSVFRLIHVVAVLSATLFASRS